MSLRSRVISFVTARPTVSIIALGAATLVAVLTLLGSAQQTQITRTWDGGGADNNWTTAGNWSSDNAPDATDEAALFTNDPVGQTKLTANLPADVTIGQLQFSASAPGYTIAGTGPSKLFLSPSASYGGVGVVVASGAANQSVTAAEVDFLSSQTWDIGGTTTLTVTGTIEDDAVLDYGLTKNGSGALVFPGDVRYDGATILNAGSLVLSFSNTSMLSALTVNAGLLRATTSANALGNSSTRNTITLTGGALELANNTGLTFGSTSRITTVTGNATIRSDRLTAGAGVTHTLGTLSIGAQTLSVAAGTNATSGTAGTTFGATTLSGNATFNVVNGGANAQLTLGAVGQSGGTRSLTKTGSGTLLLNGAASYTGGTTLGQGALTLGVANALGSGGFNFAGGTLNANNTTDSTIGALALIGNSTLNLSAGGAAATLTFSGVSGTANGILTITGWSGSPGGAGTNDKIVFSGGTTPNAAYLQHISFVLGGNTYPGALGAGGELIPSGAASGTIAFAGVEHLGNPTDTSIAINVVPDANATIYYEYGTSSAVYPQQTAPVAALANEPCEVVLTGLQPNTRYFYRMRYEAAANPGIWTARNEYQFRTQRPAGNTYSFVLTSDSHVNLQLGTLSEWQTTLDMIAAERPDFMIDLGDTFAMDNGTTAVTSAAAADQVYLFQRSAGILGRASHSVPMFFAMGNHENEEGWNFNDVNPQPIWGMKARKKYFPAPSPLTAPGFYSANTDPVEAGDVTPPNSHIIGSDQYREDYYAWAWGDALFVVFDPFQYTMQNPYGASAGEGSDDPAVGDRWNWTMGIQQHQWLNNVLSTSTAKYKFLFAHHMLGGTQNYVRGGAEPAHQFEWGGYNADGTTWGWDTQRPAAAGWIKPVRQMMIDYGVTAFFHGHDHQFAYELRDGMVYQEVPAASQGTTSGFGSYNSSPYLVSQSSNSGYLRVTISPSQALVEYLKTTGTNVGQVQYSYTMAPAAGPSYVITASAGANGSISPSGAVNVAAGANQSFVVTPNPGYAVAGVVVDGSSVGAVTNYQFSNVTANHTIAVSFAPQAVTVPNVFGLTQSAAATALASSGLVVGNITSGPHASVPVGSVIAQSPTAGSTAPAGTAVALTVSSGVTVPNVVGQTQSAATATLTTAGFLVTSSTQASASVPIGSVISQNPAGGAAVSGGSTVALVISSGTMQVGLVTAYGFDDGSGTLLTDVTGRGHNGTISGATWTSSGHSGSALSFSGSASVTVSDANDLDLTTAMTLEAWVYPTGTPSGWQAIIDKNVDRYYLMASSTPNNRPAVGGTWAAGNTNLAAPTALSANTWTHLATTFDGATVRLYVNGVQVASRVESTPLTTSTSTLQIGGDSYPNEYFAGRIDDLRIYNRALSAGEIQTDMNTPVTPPGVMVLVPNVTNILQATAQSTLIAVGLQAVITPAYSSTVPAGYVISQNPAAGASVPVGSGVTLLVSQGAQPNVPPSIVLTAPADHAAGLGTSATLTASVTDADATSVTFYGRKTAPAVPGPDFVIGTMPDTQYYSQNTGGNLAATFFTQTQWYADSRAPLNLAFISHMGDMVQSGDNGSNNSEWNIADTAMRTIEDPVLTGLPYGIPWGGAPGNHDQTTNGQVNAPNAKWNQFFGAGRWAGRPYFGGSFSPTNNSNNYELFDASGLEFLIIHLDYTTAAGVNQAVIDWADGLMKAYPRRRAIVTSHWILDVPPTSPIGASAPFGGPGQRFFDEFKDNPNFFLMLSGHQHGEGRRADVFGGRTIYSVLQDYQERANGGNGWLRYFVFSPANNTITARTYSPTLGQFETDTDATSSPLNQASQFVLTYDMQSAVAPWTALGTVNVAAGGGSAQFNWTGLEAGSTYEWYVGASDGLATTTSTARIFSTASANVAPTVTLTSPASNSTFTAPLDLPLAATAGDTDGSVTKVEFFDGTTKLGEDATSPYNYTWTNAPAGGHTLIARATDNAGATTTSTSVAITVNLPSNHAPIASGQSLTISEDAAATPITLTATDSDGDSLTSSIVAGPAHGTLGGIAPAVTYQPAANYNGADSFTFRASDGQANSNTATVSITIQPVNDAPSATGESYAAQSGSTLTIAAPGVLANDSDIDSSALTAQLTSPPSHGALTLNVNGSFSYTPAGGYTGPDAFSYVVNDGQADSGPATASFTVTAAPGPTCSLSVSPTSIAAGGTATLSWTTQNATSLLIDPGGVTATPVASGSQSVSPGSTTTYMGAVTGPGGSNSCVTVLTVTSSSGPSGLIAAYEFSAGTGTTIADSSGNNLNGTATSTTWTTAGKYGNALSFNGTSSFVNLANPAALQATGSMTWTAWVKATSTPADDGQIISKSSGSDGWQFKTSPDTGPHTFGIMITGSTGVVQRYSTTVRALNTWYHVAAVYNATARTLDIYVNGVLDDGVLLGTIPAAQTGTTTAVNIGRRSGGFYFGGVLDDVRIYGRALTPAEVQTVMSTPIP